MEHLALVAQRLVGALLLSQAMAWAFEQFGRPLPEGIQGLDVLALGTFLDVCGLIIAACYFVVGSVVQVILRRRPWRRLAAVEGWLAAGFLLFALAAGAFTQVTQDRV